MLKEALTLLGIYEYAGGANNPIIMAWAKELGLKAYTADSIAWCGLFMAIAAHRAGWPVVKDPLWARNWSKFGTGVPAGQAALGDVLVFVRGGGGHVGLYVGEDATHFHVLGGNQSDQVCITRILKSRCIAVRRAAWRNAQPANVRRVRLAASGSVSTNEA